MIRHTRLVKFLDFFMVDSMKLTTGRVTSAMYGFFVGILLMFIGIINTALVGEANICGIPASAVCFLGGLLSSISFICLVCFAEEIIDRLNSLPTATSEHPSSTSPPTQPRRQLER